MDTRRIRVRKTRRKKPSQTILMKNFSSRSIVYSKPFYFADIRDLGRRKTCLSGTKIESPDDSNGNDTQPFFLFQCVYDPDVWSEEKLQNIGKKLSIGKMIMSFTGKCPQSLCFSFAKKHCLPYGGLPGGHEFGLGESAVLHMTELWCQVMCYSWHVFFTSTKLCDDWA